jgi:dihydroorotate dehydrogenase
MFTSKSKTMYNLMSFKEARIEALLNELNKKNKRIQQLETFIFELATDECPDWYKDVVKKEVFGTTEEV